MPGTQAFGYYTQNFMRLSERLADSGVLPSLEPEEKAAYDQGNRIFEAFAGSMMKVRAV